MGLEIADESLSALITQRCLTRRPLAVLVSVVALTAVIEIPQSLVRRGLCETQDLFNNSAGAVVAAGYVGMTCPPQSAGSRPGPRGGGLRHAENPGRGTVRWSDRRNSASGEPPVPRTKARALGNHSRHSGRPGARIGRRSRCRHGFSCARASRGAHAGGGTAGRPRSERTAVLRLQRHLVQTDLCRRTHRHAQRRTRRCVHRADRNSATGITFRLT